MVIRRKNPDRTFQSISQGWFCLWLDQWYLVMAIPNGRNMLSKYWKSTIQTGVVDWQSLHVLRVAASGSIEKWGHVRRETGVCSSHEAPAAAYIAAHCRSLSRPLRECEVLSARSIPCHMTCSAHLSREPALRSSRRADGYEVTHRRSTAVSAHRVPRRYAPQAPGVFHQPLPSCWCWPSSSVACCRWRWVLYTDHATSANQSLLWYIPQGRQHSRLDRHRGLCAGGRDHEASET